MTQKCDYCDSTEKVKKISVPIERRGKVTGFRKEKVCPSCLIKYYPEYAVENIEGVPEPKTYDVLVRGRKVKTRGRNI